jgi:hypothetical protein
VNVTVAADGVEVMLDVEGSTDSVVAYTFCAEGDVLSEASNAVTV